MLGELTERQRVIFDSIVAHIGAHGTPPTMREVGLAHGIVSTNGVRDHLLALRRKGWLRPVPKRFQTRSTVPTQEAVAQVTCPTCGRSS